MEKLKAKNKNKKTIQITYPAPYLHSWINESPPVSKKRSAIRNPRAFNRPRRPNSSPKGKSQSFSAVRRPDPTAPHLKYGVFSNNRITSNRVLPKVKQQDTAIKQRSNAMNRRISDSRNSLSQSIRRQGNKNLKPQIRDSPVFVFRTADKSFTRQLSQSKVTHIDIKPRKYMSAPASFCPSPNQRLGPRFRSPARKTLR